MIAALAVAGLAAALTVAPQAPAPKPCTDKVVQVIRDTGWKNNQQRIAYAVIWRESNGNPRTVSGSDMGLFQLNFPTWGATKYWPANPLDAHDNARAAYRIWKDKGWGPWGHNRDGSVNTASYGMWSDAQIYAWITEPFARYSAQYDRLPKGCRND